MNKLPQEWKLLNNLLLEQLLKLKKQCEVIIMAINIILLFIFYYVNF